MNRKWLIFLVLIAYAGVFSSLSTPIPAGSTYSPKPTGTLAFYRFLEKDGFRVNRWLQTFDRLEASIAGPGTMVLVSPPTDGGEDELLDWVAAGNRLIYFSGSYSNSKISKNLGVEFEQSVSFFVGEQNIGTPHCEGPTLDTICSQVQTLTLPETYFTARDESYSNFSPLLSVRDLELEKVYVGHWTFGQGEVVLFSAADIIQNRNIDKFDNLRFIYQLLQKKGPIYFDEFHHGYRQPLSGTVKNHVSLIWLFVGALGFCLLVGVLSRSVRFGIPVKEELGTESANVEFVKATGELYSRHQIHSSLSNYLNSWKMRIGKETGLSWGLEDSLFVNALAAALSLKNKERDEVQKIVSSIRQAQDGERIDFSESIEILEKLVPERRSGS